MLRRCSSTAVRTSMFARRLCRRKAAGEARPQIPASRACRVIPSLVKSQRKIITAGFHPFIFWFGEEKRKRRARLWGGGGGGKRCFAAGKNRLGSRAIKTNNKNDVFL